MPTLYFDVVHAVETHDYIIATSGGLSGIKDIGQLESVLTHIKSDEYYPDFLSKLTHLIFAIDKFHAFNDGNKRSAIGLGAYFLEINGYEYCIERFIREMENIVVWVAENKINKAFLGEILEAIVIDGELNEALQLRLIDAVQ